MAKFDFSFAVQNSFGAKSSIWRLRRSGSQVYLMTSGMGGIQKYSFHTPNNCRLAHTSEFAKRTGMTNRSLQEWWRDFTPPAGEGKVVRVLRLWVGTNTLSATHAGSSKTFYAIPAAPKDWSTVVDLAFTNESESAMLAATRLSDPSHNQRLLAYDTLKNGESIVLVSHWAQVANDTLDMPKSPSANSQFGHIVISPRDPENTGRPLRITAYPHAKDGDFTEVWEFGAYEIADGEPKERYFPDVAREY